MIEALHYSVNIFGRGLVLLLGTTTRWDLIKTGKVDLGHHHYYDVAF